mgnify:CR=1 FL=1|tara:strand:+ start:77 stop:313 length:237 start_codon:yes stop_codon:yes gene_type:complete
MPSAIAQKALKNKAITKRQYDKLPAHLLDKVADHNLKLQGKARKTAAPGGTKETRKKTGAQKGKPGRPKAGSLVKVKK